MAQCLDWYLSGDINEAAFHRKWEKDLSELEEERNAM